MLTKTGKELTESKLRADYSPSVNGTGIGVAGAIVGTMAPSMSAMLANELFENSDLYKDGRNSGVKGVHELAKAMGIKTPYIVRAERPRDSLSGVIRGRAGSAVDRLLTRIFGGRENVADVLNKSFKDSRGGVREMFLRNNERGVMRGGAHTIVDAHELGHLNPKGFMGPTASAAAQLSASLGRFLALPGSVMVGNVAYRNRLRELSGLAANKSDIVTEEVSKWAPSAFAAPSLFEEARASAHALRALNKAKGLGYAGKSLLPLSLAFGTYLAPVAMPHVTANRARAAAEAEYAKRWGTKP